MAEHLDSSTLINVYDAATNPGQWSVVVDGMADIADSAGCIMLLSDHDDVAPWSVSALSTFWQTMPPERLETYQAKFKHNEAAVFDWLGKSPVYTLACTSDPALAHHAPPDREDIQYLVQHFRIRHRAAFRLNDNPAWMDSLAFQFDASIPAVPVEQVDRVRPYLPHLSKTLEYSRLYGRLQRAHEAVLAALDRVRVGMVIVTETRDVITANRAASELLDAVDGVRQDVHGKLAACDKSANGLLAHACLTHTHTARGTADEPGIMLLAPRKGQRLPLLLEITPLRDGLHEIDRGLAAAMVMIIDPEADDCIDTAPLARVCNLTEAEADVCHYLVSGLSNPRIAERRCTHPDTVKSQIACIFQKTGVNSRTELVRLAVRTDPPVDSGPFPMA